jgi:hypothetical protein
MTLSDLQTIAIVFYEARATIIRETIGNPSERGRRLTALGQQFQAGGECVGVGVEVIVPLYRIAGRQPHFRFRYVADGKQVSEATACALVEGCQPNEKRRPVAPARLYVAHAPAFDAAPVWSALRT